MAGVFETRAIVQPSDGAPKCASCAESFRDAADLRIHWKSARHLYNMKNRGSDFTPLTQEEWNETHGKESPVFSSIPKAGVTCLPVVSSCSPNTTEFAGKGSASSTYDSPCDCLFDDLTFSSVDENMSYMEKTYSFFIPYPERLIDLHGLLMSLGTKIKKPPHSCICCGRAFPSLASVRRHMRDKSHTHIGTEAFSRRGKYDVLGSLCMQNELKPFYKEVGEHGQLPAYSKSAHDVETPNMGHDIKFDGAEDILVSTLDTCSSCISEDEIQLILKDLGRTASQKPNAAYMPRCSRSHHWRNTTHPQRRLAGKGLAFHKNNWPSLKVLLKSQQADIGEIQTVLARQLQIRQQWTGTIIASEANLRRTPRVHAPFEKSGLFDGGHKLNQERGNACRGQGKRHQNAAVHGQPKQNRGRLAKWC